MSLIIFIVLYILGTLASFYAWRERQGKEFLWLSWLGCALVLLSVIKLTAKEFFVPLTGFDFFAYIISGILLVGVLLIGVRIIYIHQKK